MLPKELREKANIKMEDMLVVIAGCDENGEICCLILVKANLIDEKLRVYTLTDAKGCSVVSKKEKVEKELLVIEKYLTFWIFLAIIFGVALGYVFPR